ncbi:hypothetical protein [Mesorhizobium sp. Z1-4]|uniref:hypothetical protein n=1 Tax=Mesorhizobium sp. Z1-4 TaxID=2448478 RepID=UPI000FDC6DCA|nr:hypothetical protein [Mesorhizobium sp. Z1-4]
MTEQWTAKQVESQIIEAAETLRMLPGGHGLARVGGSWVEYALDYSAIRIRARPSPGAIDRMHVVWGWINALPSESDRRLLYGWADVKATKGRKVEDFAEREAIKTRTLRWLVSRLCQGIADRLNGETAEFRQPRQLDALADFLAHETAHSVAASRPQRSPSHIPPDQRPGFDTSPDAMKRVAREIEKSNRRIRKRRGRKG